MGAERAKETTMSESVDLNKLGKLFVSAFPEMDIDEQKLSLTLYRLLAKGAPVSREQLAKVTGQSLENINHTLGGWQDIFYDDDDCVIGFLGLTSQEMPHRLEVNGHTVYTWCAWDTLFIPELLGATAHVTSTCPVTQKEIKLIVSPAGIKAVNADEVWVSFVSPDENELRENVTTSFCHFVYFFADRTVAERWIKEHPGTFLLSLDDAFAVGKQVNAARYMQTLNQ